MFSFRSKLVTVFIIFVVAVFSATLAMIAVYSLPSKFAFENVKKSISLYEKEGVYPVWTGDKYKFTTPHGESSWRSLYDSCFSY